MLVPTELVFSHCLGWVIKEALSYMSLIPVVPRCSLQCYSIHLCMTLIWKILQITASWTLGYLLVWFRCLPFQDWSISQDATSFLPNTILPPRQNMQRSKIFGA